MNGINLIPAYRRRARLRRRRLRAWACGAAAYGLTLCAGYAWLRASLAGGGEHLNHELLAARQEIGAASAGITAKRSLAADAEAVLRANRAVSHRPDWSRLLVVLGRCAGEGIVLKRLKLDPESGEGGQGGQKLRPERFGLALNGLGKAHEDVAAFVRALEETRIFERVALVETRREAFLESDAVGFVLRCVLIDTGAGK